MVLSEEVGFVEGNILINGFYHFLLNAVNDSIPWYPATSRSCMCSLSLCDRNLESLKMREFLAENSNIFSINLISKECPSFHLASCIVPSDRCGTFKNDDRDLVLFRIGIYFLCVSYPLVSMYSSPHEIFTCSERIEEVTSH